MYSWGIFVAAGVLLVVTHTPEVQALYKFCVPLSALAPNCCDTTAVLHLWANSDFQCSRLFSLTLVIF